MKTGWISLHRKIQDSFLWKDGRVFSKAEAWIDILMEVQYDEKEQKIMIGNFAINCNRGQTIKSISTWALRWKWSRSAVHRFLSLLKREKMITTENVKKTTRLTVCNYSTYQNKRNDSETIVKRSRNDSETSLNTDNKGNKGNNENNDKNKEIFDQARKLYPDRKRGLEPEFENFKKKHKNWKEILPLLEPAIKQQIIWRNKDGQYWKNFKTWINNSCWTEEPAQGVSAMKPKDKCYVCGSEQVSATHNERWHCPKHLKEARGW